MFGRRSVAGVSVGLSGVLAGCATVTASPSEPLVAPALTLAIDRPSADVIVAEYRSAAPFTALHFARKLGAYRPEFWRTPNGFRWEAQGKDEWIARIDGRPFDRIAFTIPIRYSAIPKGFAPFSPFSEGSALIYSGQFHACDRAPCDEAAPLPVSVTAKGQIVGVGGNRRQGRATFVSQDDGTNIFVGTLAPVRAEGFVAIIDPGLPPLLRAHLDTSLPQAVQQLTAVYGPLSFVPELYVSIDARRQPDGHVSTQGGVLPRQVFMHFDGADPNRGKSGGASPFWLDFFFAHEVAHLVQQDRTDRRSGDDVAAWLHEGGADAMAAVALASRGAEARTYVQGRVREAVETCAKGLAEVRLDEASAGGQFDLHYQCGLVIWLALDADLQRAGTEGLADLNRAFFAAVRAGKPWSPTTYMATARELGASEKVLGQVAAIAEGGVPQSTAALAQLGHLAMLSLQGD